MRDEINKLKALKVEEFLIESVEIDPLRIQEHYVSIAAQYAFWSHKFADAERIRDLTKVEEARVRGTLELKHRQDMLDAGAKPTESQIAARVNLDPTLFDITTELVEASFHVTRLKGVLQALSIKNQSLMSLGAHVRQEMQGDPLLRQQARNASAFNRDNG